MQRHPLLSSLALFGLLVWIPAVIGAEPSREYQVKAAFIYNFTQFVEWPADSFADADAPLIVAVVGDDPFGGALQQAFAGKLVGTRRVVVRNLATVDQIGPCQLLFVPASQAASLPTILKRLNGAPTLTVGESDGFTADGGGICFYTENNKLRFEVNLDASEQARLKISSKLLKLARIFKK